MGAIKTFLRSLTDEELQRVIDAPVMGLHKTWGCLAQAAGRWDGVLVTDATYAAAAAFDALTSHGKVTWFEGHRRICGRKWSHQRATRVVQEAALRLQAQRRQTPQKVSEKHPTFSDRIPA